jgi:uncharacterized membrane protein
MIARSSLLALALAATACQSGGDGGAATKPFDGIAPNETIRFTGTEPFWGGETQGGSLTYTTPEDPDGTTIAVERFAGNSGLGLSGKLGDEAFDMTVTIGTCSDGMSDREYPFTVTLRIGEDTRFGCAWTAAHPFAGPESP